MPRIPKTKPAKSILPAAPPPPEESRAKLADEIEHLNSLAAAVRGSVSMPDIKTYVQAGYGTTYQRHYDICMQHKRVASAFEEAAFRLEQAFTSLSGVSRS